MKKHMSEAAKGRAIGLLEAGIGVGEVAKGIGVTRQTISRLKARKSNEEPSEVPQRRAGSGRRKKYDQQLLDKVEAAMEKNPHLNSTDLKRMMPRLLRNISGRTVRRLLDVELDRPARVSAEKPRLTEAMKERRLEWAKRHLRRRKRTWERALFVDEVMFEARGAGGCWRLVRRRRGASRYEEKYCRKKFKRPSKVMALGGITSSGSRFLSFLPTNKMEEYTKMLRKAPSRIAKKRNLMIMHDASKVHTAKKTSRFLKEQDLKCLVLPGNSPDLNPIEHCFALLKRRLERHPTRTIKELKVTVRNLWHNLSDEYINTLCNSMGRRMSAVIKSNGGVTKY